MGPKTSRADMDWSRATGPVVYIGITDDTTSPTSGDSPLETTGASAEEPETVTEVVTEQVTVNPSVEREADLDDPEAALDDRVADLDTREEQLDKRKQRLDDREEEIAGAEREAAANTFTDGIYVVGSDIEPGTYVTDGEGGTNPAGCYAARLDDAGEPIDNDIGEGQRVFTVGSAARVESAGGCTWTRQ
jgi:hypothetical protein